MNEAVRVVKTLQGDGLREREDVAAQRTEYSLAQEAKSWDHLIVQMADWNEREQCWNEFKKRYESGGKKEHGKKIFGRSM